MLLDKIKAPESESTILDAGPESAHLSQSKPEHVRRLACHRRKAADGALVSTWTTKDEPRTDKEMGPAAQSFLIDRLIEGQARTAGGHDLSRGPPAQVDMRTLPAMEIDNLY